MNTNNNKNNNGSDLKQVSNKSTVGETKVTHHSDGEFRSRHQPVLFCSKHNHSAVGLVSLIYDLMMEAFLLDD